MIRTRELAACVNYTRAETEFWGELIATKDDSDDGHSRFCSQPHINGKPQASLRHKLVFKTN